MSCQLLRPTAPPLASTRRIPCPLTLRATRTDPTKIVVGPGGQRNLQRGRYRRDRAGTDVQCRGRANLKGAITRVCRLSGRTLASNRDTWGGEDHMYFNQPSFTNPITLARPHRH
jgi:hypothetical protein